MKVLFWGSPDFALPSLRALLDAGHDVVGVVTNPDRPAGRGREPRPTPVKEEALRHDLLVLQPERPRGEEFLDRLRDLCPEVSAVAAYGQILGPDVLELPERGSLNVHASLLPELRGAAPINWAVIRGHQRTGVTIMRMVEELDAGPILLQEEVEIGPRATAGELFERLSRIGGEALVEALDRLERGEVEPREQNHDRATYAPKLDSETARLDWSLPAEEVDRWIRGLDPWPGAWSLLDGETRVALYAPAGVEERVPEAAAEAADTVDAGRVLEADPREGVLVAAGGGAVRLGDVKPAGSSRMSAAAWVRGRGVGEGARLE